jgi:hypothetical protein
MTTHLEITFSVLVKFVYADTDADGCKKRVVKTQDRPLHLMDDDHISQSFINNRDHINYVPYTDILTDSPNEFASEELGCVVPFTQTVQMKHAKRKQNHFHMCFQWQLEVPKQIPSEELTLPDIEELLYENCRQFYSNDNIIFIDDVIESNDHYYWIQIVNTPTDIHFKLTN